MRKISVIMPIYNEKVSWVQKSLDSILIQTYSNFEIIIILDNPDNQILKDFLLKKEKQLNNITLIINENNLGIVDSLNKGILESSGELIARMDGDDISLPDRFQKEVDFLNNENLDMVTTTVEDVDESGTVLTSRVQEDLIGDSFRQAIRYKYLGAHPTWLGKRQMFEKLGGYRSVMYVEDLDFLLRALEQNYSIGLLGTPTLKYRVRKKSITSSNQLDMFINSLSVRTFFYSNILSSTTPCRIMEKSSKIDSVDRKKYSKISKMRKDIFYLFNNNKLDAVTSLPKLFVLIIFNKYARMLMINDIKRIINKKSRV